MSVDSRQALETIYNAFMAMKGRDKMKRKHPSLEEFCDIIEYTSAWALALREIEKQNGGPDAKQ